MVGRGWVVRLGMGGAAGDPGGLVRACEHGSAAPLVGGSLTFAVSAGVAAADRQGAPV
jgi:hypothetical protein